LCKHSRIGSSPLPNQIPLSSKFQCVQRNLILKNPMNLLAISLPLSQNLLVIQQSHTNVPQTSIQESQDIGPSRLLSSQSHHLAFPFDSVLKPNNLSGNVLGPERLSRLSHSLSALRPIHTPTIGNSSESNVGLRFYTIRRPRYLSETHRKHETRTSQPKNRSE